MKKRLYIVLLVVLILFSFGCQKEDKYSKYIRIAVLSNEEADVSKILFLNADHQVVYELETEFVDEVVHIDDRLYIGKDKNNYQTIDCIAIEFLDDIHVEKGILLHYSENGSYVIYLDGKCNVIDKAGTRRQLEGYLLNYLVCNDLFYMIDYSNYLYCYSVNDYELKSKTQLFNSEFISLTEVDDRCYIVSSRGFTLIEDGEAKETFVYPYDFNEVLSVYRDKIVVKENNEQMVYRVFFDEHKMKLEPIYDEIYYTNIKFNEIFKECYDLGYKVVYYGEK